MFAPLTLLLDLATNALLASGHTSPQASLKAPVLGHRRFFDVQAHRGGRGNTIENTLPSFAWGLIDGASTLELDNGITKDGVVIVWHDEEITPEKCIDTVPVYPGDPDFPYVGKYIANLTLAQIKTLDLFSLLDSISLAAHVVLAMQLTYPGTRISTMEEVFQFAECADPAHDILWNIESKINAEHPNRTLGVSDFVEKQGAVFAKSAYAHAITYQSFDWRTLVAMKSINPSIITSALIDSNTAAPNTPWLAGHHLETFPGHTLGQRIAQAAHAIRADILSPSAKHDASSIDPDIEGWVAFTTRDMVDKAHELGVAVKPFTVNRLTIAEQLLEVKVDGIITDYPNVVRRLIKHKGMAAAPKYPKQRVLACLDEHLARQG